VDACLVTTAAAEGIAAAGEGNCGGTVRHGAPR
jgi:hypothetical protein